MNKDDNIHFIELLQPMIGNEVLVNLANSDTHSLTQYSRCRLTPKQPRYVFLFHSHMHKEDNSSVVECSQQMVQVLHVLNQVSNDNKTSSNTVNQIATKYLYFLLNCDAPCKIIVSKNNPNNICMSCKFCYYTAHCNIAVANESNNR